MRGALLVVSLLTAICSLEHSSAAVLFKPFSVAFPDLPAKYARPVDIAGVCGELRLSDPLDGCSSLGNVVRSKVADAVLFALIARGNCSFEEKVLNAQIAGYRAAIVYDDRDKGNLVYMMVDPRKVDIPAVFVSKGAGEFLNEHAWKGDGECCIYPSHTAAAWTVLAICFLSVLVILSFLGIAFLAPRRWSSWRGRNQQFKSVDSNRVEALPRVTFNSSQLNGSRMGETCAICLEDYKDGEILKVLPCQHDFHSSCVEVWLNKWGTCCPVCKLDMTMETTYSEVKGGTCVSLT